MSFLDKFRRKSEEELKAEALADQIKDERGLVKGNLAPDHVSKHDSKPAGRTSKPGTARPQPKANKGNEKPNAINMAYDLLDKIREDSRNKLLMESLNMVYFVLRNHVEHEDLKKPDTLMQYFGYDEDNLTHIFMALFGESEDADQDFEIHGLLKGPEKDKLDKRGNVIEEEEDLADFIIKKMLCISETTDVNTIQPRFEKMIKGLQELTDLRKHASGRAEQIKSLILAIREREYDEKGSLIRRLTSAEQIRIAKEDKQIKRFEGGSPMKFDESILANRIANYQSGRKLDPVPNA